MKKYLILATVALVVLSCEKNPETEPSGDNPAIAKGQSVSISCCQGQTKVSGTADGTGVINFLWQDNDYIFVTINGKSGYFTIKSGQGSSSATFTGEMPADTKAEDTIYIQWPDSTPDLSAQDYVTDGIDGGKMLAEASVIGVSRLKEGKIELKAQYAVLWLNLKGADKVTKVTVSVDATSKNFTMTCPSIQLNTEIAVPVYVVLPTCEATSLTIRLTGEEDADLGTFRTSRSDLPLQKAKVLKLNDLNVSKGGEMQIVELDKEAWK